MKIDKGKPAHWLYLAAFGFNVLLAMVMRPFAPRSRRPRVLLYGHKLNGNLLAIYRRLQDAIDVDAEAIFLTMDPAYYRELVAEGASCCLTASSRCATLLATADSVISDHGLHAMSAMVGRTSLKFYDVWHGIPFKGFDADDFRVQHRFDEIWVASDLMRDMYVERFGFSPGRVHTTGYARTDRLVRGCVDVSEQRRMLGLPGDRKVVLFAPTWAQDTQGRNVFPFGLDEGTFTEALSAVAERNDAVVVLRTHLNTGGSAERGAPPSKILRLPHARYPDTEAVLLAADVLICDWSSIAFDYLLLNRPTLFLDVPAPFRKGFSLGPEYRYGPLVSDLDTLTAKLQQCLSDAAGYWRQFEARHERVRAEVYGEFADGRCTERCVQRLRRGSSL